MSFTRVDDLLGAWRLESAVEVFDDGERRDEFGPNPEGYLCYNPVGIVSATLGDSARPPVSAGDPQSGTDDDYEKMDRHFIAYAGPFSVDVGNDLTAELAATGPDRRAFVIVWPYHASPRPPEAAQPLAGLTRRRRAFFSKILNADREEEGEVRYGCAVVEVEEAALATYLETAAISDSARLEQRPLARRMDLNSLEAALPKNRLSTRSVARTRLRPLARGSGANRKRADDCLGERRIQASHTTPWLAQRSEIPALRYASASSRLQGRAVGWWPRRRETARHSAQWSQWSRPPDARILGTPRDR
jgi:hypothetical protein